METIRNSTAPLVSFEKIRADVLRDVVNRTEAETRQVDSALEEMFFLERLRMNRQGWGNPYILWRFLRDRKMLRWVKAELLKAPGEANRTKVFRHALEHYAEEVGGHFKPGVYDLAVRLVPMGFNWLLNAASLNHFKPWGQKQLLDQRLKVTGHLEMVRALAKKGTVILTPTHQSNIDSVLIGWVIYLMGLPPFCYGAGLNLFSNPLLSFFMSGLGAYTVDRQKSFGSYKGLLKNYSTRILEEGIHSIFFPAGGRVRSGAIESHLKLGLLGTGLTAQIENLKKGRENPNVYVVPMTITYDFVLEASSLVEQYLGEIGKQKYLGAASESILPVVKGARFFWSLFKSESMVYARVGQPMDVFGNPVDEFGRSMGPNGTTIDVRRWLTTTGELEVHPDRDREYTRELGERIVEGFYANNTVQSTQIVPFAYFNLLRRKYPDFDLFRVMRLSPAQRSLPLSEFLTECERLRDRVRELSDAGRIQMAQDLYRPNVEAWVRHGVAHLGAFHGNAVLKIDGDVVISDDMGLLYYYRNRLTGYGLSQWGLMGSGKSKRGVPDEAGFLD